ncbi:MAG: gamma-glutamylcyclotransferase family protein [Actinomycetota bacterium]
MLYFAYGANMNPAAMRAMSPGARSAGTARLSQHRVAFVRDRYGFASGVATVVADRSEQVWGILWSLGDDDLPALDVWEAHPIAYRRAGVTLFAPEPVRAWAYVATSTAPRAPSREYLRGILRGAEAFALPPEYRRCLRRWAEQT